MFTIFEAAKLRCTRSGVHCKKETIETLLFTLIIIAPNSTSPCLFILDSSRKTIWNYYFFYNRKTPLFRPEV